MSEVAAGPTRRGSGPGAPLTAEDDALAQCIQCGLCLPACPTYDLTPLERANPRGRIGLMRAVADGRMAADDPAYAEAMYYCTGCRACETACPAGVEFGRLIERARTDVERAGGPGRPDPATRDWLLDHALASPRRLAWAARGLAAWRRTLGRSARARRALARALPGLAALARIAPPLPPRDRRRVPSALDPADLAAGGAAPAPRGTVAVHPGCVQAVFLPEVNADTLQVLAHNGWRALVPEGAACCGALHAHHGRTDEARALARRNVAAFEDSGAEALVSNAAGCGAFFQEYGDLLADDPEWAGPAARLAETVRDVSEHLVRHGVRRPRRPFGLRVTYDDPCHLLHGQRVAVAPRLLLRTIPGLDLVPLADAARCCGSAGIYNLTHPEPAGALLDAKLARIAETGAELVVTGNAGCILHLAAGLREAGSSVRVLHPVSLLRAAYELPARPPGRGRPWSGPASSSSRIRRARPASS